MNVIREDVDALNANLKVQIEPADYQDSVKKTLENYRKTAKIPGFRPGHVPFGMIQKQYGKSVLAEELNKIVNKALYDYLDTNKVDILGNPIPDEETEVSGSFDKPENFEFTYRIGLAPQFEVKLSGRNKYEYVQVKVDKELIDKQINDLTRRYGKLTSTEEVGEKDMVLGQFVELNEDGSIKEGGILNSSTISMEAISDEETRKALIGKKAGEKVTVEASKISRDEKDMASMLGIKPEEIAEHGSTYQLTINDIKHMEPAELNEELFDKLFGPGNVTSEEELRERVEKDLQGMFKNDSDRMLTNSIYKDLIEKTQVELPNEFLKKWIKMSNEKPISDEQIEAEYDNYAKSLKWQLIQGNIFKTNDMQIRQEEVIDFTKSLLVNNYAQYGMPAPEDQELTASAVQILQNKEEANKVQEMLIENKLTEYFKNTVKLDNKEVSYDEFVEIASK